MQIKLEFHLSTGNRIEKIYPIADVQIEEVVMGVMSGKVIRLPYLVVVGEMVSAFTWEYLEKQEIQWNSQGNRRTEINF